MEIRHFIFSIGLCVELWFVCYAFECDFNDPACGWTWSEKLTLLSADNISSHMLTAPKSNADGKTNGQFLYFGPTEKGENVKLEIWSPSFDTYTYSSCMLEGYFHMYNMDNAEFHVSVKSPNTSSWVVVNVFYGNSRNKWEILEETISSSNIPPFHIIIEIVISSTSVPSHVAIDKLIAVNCFEKKRVTTECESRQFKCLDLNCIEAHQVCDTVEDCDLGEDERKGCDELPESAYCTFEIDSCGWSGNSNGKSMWVRHKGESPNFRTGPSFDHTVQNDSGSYMLAKFPSGRSFGESAEFTSPMFNPPPYYHRNVHSAFFNSCGIRFFYHKYGPNTGELRVFSLEEDDPSSEHLRETELWRSFGNKGNFWWPAFVPLPNISHRFQIQFVAGRGVGHSDIAIDDITLSPECFAIGVPENETMVAPYEAGEFSTASPKKQGTVIKSFKFGTCGAKGRFGPTQSMCKVAYRNISTKVHVSNEPGAEGIQVWTVPADGVYTIFINGAGGGTGVTARRESLGTTIRATYNWLKGEVIYILVGQQGIDACSRDSIKLVQEVCRAARSRRDIKTILNMNKNRDQGGGAGGGGATYVFKIDSDAQTKIPLLVAGGGGGLSAVEETVEHLYVNPNGVGIVDKAPINGYSGEEAGGGGGWDEATKKLTGGQSLREGSIGGHVCERANIWETHGGFGGGGGGCASGGGGGGFRGGDASVMRGNTFNGYGGTSYLSPDGMRTMLKPGSHTGDGSAIIIPAQSGCGCQHLCVFLDLKNREYYCICPNGLTLNLDGRTCNDGAFLNSPTMWIVSILGALTAIAVVTICTHFGLTKFRKSQTYRDLSHEPINNPEVQLNMLMVTENNPNYEFVGSTYSEQDLRAIPREQLTLVKALGQGAFGEVYQGFLTNPIDNSERPVAVKTLPELSTQQAEMDFLMEALIMSKFNHLNIVTFLGVCFEKMPHFIVLELLPGGDLKSFLREHRPKPQKPSTLTVSDLLKLAMDVAKGCQYLEENRFIHRDIAARNCLLTAKDESRIVKIADFGMARDIYRADYYRKGGKAMLPVKWMPPEAFLDGIFTSKTDIWSFGVLLWEVISLGYMPYPGRGNQEVMQLVTSGGRLEPPTNCPSPVYHIMMQCWHPLPNERPNFTTILERLGYCLQDPDVINAPLPVFHKPPSMERDATVMRPNEDDSAGCCLQVQRSETGALLSPGSEDYMIPTPRSMYSLTTERSDAQSTASIGSNDQLLEMADRQNASPRPSAATWETNFSSRQHSSEDDNDQTSRNKNLQTPNEEPSTNLKKKAGGYIEVPKSETPLNGPKKIETRKSSNPSVEALPIAPIVSNENDLNSIPNTTNQQPLDPSALAKQMCSGDNLPRRYINVDVNCNTGSDPTSRSGGQTDQNNRNVLLPIDGYAGVNPVA